jgi:hypothetical protein
LLQDIRHFGGDIGRFRLDIGHFADIFGLDQFIVNFGI